jgi:hypothetical protein
MDIRVGPGRTKTYVSLVDLSLSYSPGCLFQVPSSRLPLHNDRPRPSMRLKRYVGVVPPDLVGYSVDVVYNGNIG